MNLHKHQSYLLEQQWVIRNFVSNYKVYTEGKSLIMKLGPDPVQGYTTYVL